MASPASASSRRRSTRALEGAGVDAVPGLFDYLAGAVPLVIFVVIAARAVIFARRLHSQGITLRPKPPSGTIFSESGVKGSVSGTWHTTVSGSGLIVWVTPVEFFLSLPFPLNLLGHTLRQPISWAIPPSQVKVQPVIDHKAVSVLLQYTDGRTSLVTLRPREPEKLRAALRT